MEVLQKVLGMKVGKNANTAESEEAEKQKSSPQEETKSENEWRHMPTCDMDLMIISSFGDEWEMEAIIDQCRGDKTLFLQDVCPDFPGTQLSKDDHIDRIKQFLQKCEKDEG